MIFAITDERNTPPGANMTPLMVGLIVVAIGMAFGGMHGYAINPARDFGPRLFTVVAGFKNNGLTDGALVFWVPIVGPLLGGVIGAGLYDLVIRKTLPQASKSVSTWRGRHWRRDRKRARVFVAHVFPAATPLVPLFSHRLADDCLCCNE